jgi:glycosyltransferase involved in cell wall biosynthesis
VPARIVCCSNHAMQLHASIGFRPEKMTVIPNGFDLNQFNCNRGLRDETRHRLRLDGNTPVIGMVARFDPLKDHQNLITALRIVRERGGSFTCLLAGAGMTPANKQLNTLLAQAGLEDCVRLMGPLDNVPAIMNALDLHVLSSAGESFPNVLAEAMACGTPCVTTGVGDASLIVGDQGWMVPPRCAPALANAILAALAERADHPCRWQQRQNTGRDRIVRHYALDRMTDAYRNLWNELQTSISFQVQAHRP